MAQLTTGCKCIDQAIGGGIAPQTITLLYGEPETGKTTLAIQCAVSCAIQNHKVLFVDCENTFSAKRLMQVAGSNFDAVAERIVLVKPKDFKEQTTLIDTIQDYTNNVGLIIIDTFTSLYGAKVSETSRKPFSLNRELNRQLAILAQLTKTKKIPLVITSQVRSVFTDESASVRPVATRVVKFWADNIIALKPTDFPRVVEAMVEKAGENAAPVTCYIQIGENGIVDAELQ